jgi:thioredoxin-like negative regulator of GroEL
VFCYVWAAWCAPCKSVGPRFESLAEAHAGHAAFLKIDADGCVDFLRAHGIKGIPVILALQGSTELGRLPGEPSFQKIEQFIQERLTGGSENES